MKRSARQIADQRSYRNRHSPTHDGVLGDSDRIDREGVMGEKVFAALFGIPEDEIVQDHTVKYNFRLIDGTKVDVRASSHRDATLIIDPRTLVRNDADVFVLVQLNKDATSGKVSGWATRKEVEASTPAKISDRPGATKVHRLYKWQLHDIESLMARHVMMTKKLF
jgi:hypothetical protein